MSSSTMTIRLAAEDKALITEFAGFYGKSVSDFIRETALERITNELDLKAWDEAMEEYERDPVSFTSEEIEKKYF